MADGGSRAEEPLDRTLQTNSSLSKKRNCAKRKTAFESKENKLPARAARKNSQREDEPVKKSRNLKFRPPGLADVTNQILSISNQSTVSGKGKPLANSSKFQNICDVRRMRGASNSSAERPLIVAQDIRKVLSSKKGLLTLAASHGRELVAAQKPASAIDAPLRQTCSLEDLPVDWSLKTSCRFTSDQSFDCRNTNESIRGGNKLSNIQRTTILDTMKSRCNQPHARCQGIQASEKCAGLHSFVSSQTLIGLSQGSGPSYSSASDSPDDPLTVDFSQSSQSQDSINHGASLQEALYSWVHPESSLPVPVLVSLTAAASKGNCPELDFLDKRKESWEDSLRSLYSMFRVKPCETFYVQAQSTLAMFFKVSEDGGTTLHPRAQLSRSTRGLRVALQEQDISFTMPLCEAGTNAVGMEEIQALREFEKMKPGQTRHVDTMASVDGTTDSLLLFSGALAVHGLLEFLINNRHMLGPAVGSDVPILYSRSPFANASLRAPEVVCRKSQRGAEPEGELAGFLYSKPTGFVVEYMMELKGLVLMPWVIARLCRLLSWSQQGSFKASFTTDPQSEAFNCSFGNQMHVVEEVPRSVLGIEDATNDGSLWAWQPSILDKAYLRFIGCQGDECTLHLAMACK